MSYKELKVVVKGQKVLREERGNVCIGDPIFCYVFHRWDLYPVNIVQTKVVQKVACYSQAKCYGFISKPLFLVDLRVQAKTNKETKRKLISRGWKDDTGEYNNVLLMSIGDRNNTDDHSLQSTKKKQINKSICGDGFHQKKKTQRIGCR